MAKELLREISPSLYLDLERPSDARKLEAAELFFLHHTGLICIDEIQHQPELFPILRSVVDAHPQMGQFIILGSASREIALEDLGISKAWVVYPWKDRYPLKKGVEVISLHGLLSLSL